MNERFSPRDERELIRLNPDRTTQEQQEFHKKRIEQKEGMALVGGEILDAIDRQPDIQPQELEQTFRGFVDELELAGYQEQIGKKLIKAFAQRQEHLRTLKAKNYLPKDLLERVAHPRVGPRTQNEVQVTWGPYAVHITMPDQVYRSLPGAQPISSSAGFFSRDTPYATFGNSRFFRLNLRTDVHEGQHAMYELVRGVLSKELSKTIFHPEFPDADQAAKQIQHEGIAKTVSDYSDQLLLAYGDRVKDELFAFTKEGQSRKDVQTHLLREEKDGGMYQYYFARAKTFAWKARLAVDDFAGREWEEKILDEAKTRHHDLVKQGLDALEQLMGKEGYTFHQAFIFLMDVPLELWGKEVKRLGLGKQST